MSYDLSNIKPGDKVVREAGFGGMSIVLVEKVTNTQVVTSVGRFRRDNGYEVPREKWNTVYIRPVTEEDIAKIEYRNNAERLSKVNWFALPRELVAQVCTLLDDEAARKDGANV